MTPKSSPLEDSLHFQFGMAGIQCEREYRFAAEHVGHEKGMRTRLNEHDLKDWRFDFALPDKKIAIEVEGGTWINGGHVRGKYYEDNCNKYNAAQILGWQVLRFTGDQVKSGRALSVTQKLVNEKNARH